MFAKATCSRQDEVRSYMYIYSQNSKIDETLIKALFENHSISEEEQRSYVSAFASKLYDNGNVMMHYFLEDPEKLKNLLAYSKKFNIQ